MTTSYDSNNRTNNDDEQWQEFLDNHADDLNDVSNSRTAHKFEQKAQKIEQKRDKERSRIRLRVEDFNDDVFTDRRHTTRGYSVSWLDADEADNHFNAPNPSWSSLSSGITISALVIIAGFVCIIVASTMPAFTNLLGTIGALLLIIGFAVFGTFHRRHLSGRSTLRDRNNPDNGARL